MILQNFFGLKNSEQSISTNLKSPDILSGRAIGFKTRNGILLQAIPRPLRVRLPDHPCLRYSNIKHEHLPLKQYSHGDGYVAFFYSSYKSNDLLAQIKAERFLHEKNKRK